VVRGAGGFLIGSQREYGWMESSKWWEVMECDGDGYVDCEGCGR
jgi:hypothetical protein